MWVDRACFCVCVCVCVCGYFPSLSPSPCFSLFPYLSFFLSFFLSFSSVSLIAPTFSPISASNRCYAAVLLIVVWVCHKPESLLFITTTKVNKLTTNVEAGSRHLPHAGHKYSLRLAKTSVVFIYLFISCVRSFILSSVRSMWPQRVTGHQKLITYVSVRFLVFVLFFWRVGWLVGWLVG